MKPLEKLIMNIADLFKLKSIMSLVVVITTCVLTFKGIVNVGEFMIMSASIITYYFTRKKDGKEDN